LYTTAKLELTMPRCGRSLPSFLVLATMSLAGCASVRSPKRSPGQTSATIDAGQRDSVDRAPAPRISLRMPSAGLAGGQYVELMRTHSSSRLTEISACT
jgi:uncharacterized protein YceK